MQYRIVLVGPYVVVQDLQFTKRDAVGVGHGGAVLQVGDHKRHCADGSAAIFGGLYATIHAQVPERLPVGRPALCSWTPAVAAAAEHLLQHLHVLVALLALFAQPIAPVDVCVVIHALLLAWATTRQRTVSETTEMPAQPPATGRRRRRW